MHSNHLNMNQPIKFPDLRPANPKVEIHIPPPSGFVQRVPTFPTTDAGIKNRRFERKRLILWFGIAAALHAALFLGIWLMPPLRIKWEPSPDAWVLVTSLPKEPPAAQAPAGTTPLSTRPAGTAKTASAPKAKKDAKGDPAVPAVPAVPVSLLP
jgi:hypothetical protein